MNPARFKKELARCDSIVEPSCQDSDPAEDLSSISEQYRSCKKLIEDMVDLEPEEKLRTMIEGFKID